MSAARLYSLGVDLEAARERLRQLNEQNTAFDSDEMRQACLECEELDRQWKNLEKEYLELRDEILSENR